VQGSGGLARHQGMHLQWTDSFFFPVFFFFFLFFSFFFFFLLFFYADHLLRTMF